MSNEVPRGRSPASTRRYCYYEPGPFLIIEKEPEVAACDTGAFASTAGRLYRLPGMILMRVARRTPRDRHLCVSLDKRAVCRANNGKVLVRTNRIG